mgnify:CR=1 FL=1
MVLHTRGRVGRRQLFYKPLSTDLLREAFFALIFWRVGASSPEMGESRPLLKMMRPHLGATRPRVGIVKLGFDPPTWQ